MSADFVLYSFHLTQNCFATESEIIPREIDGHSNFIQYVYRLRGRVYILSQS